MAALTPKTPKAPKTPATPPTPPTPAPPAAIPERRDPRDPLVEAVLLALSGATAEALASLEEASFEPAVEPCARAFQSELLERLDRWGDAWTVLATALAAFPDHAGLALRAGVSCSLRGDVEAARRFLHVAWVRGALPEAAFRLGELARAEASGEDRRWWALAVAAEGAGGEWRRRAEALLAAEEGGR